MVSRRRRGPCLGQVRKRLDSGNGLVDILPDPGKGAVANTDSGTTGATPGGQPRTRRRFQPPPPDMGPGGETDTAGGRAAVTGAKVGPRARHTVGGTDTD